MRTAEPPPLFILSFRHRDELQRVAEEGGWRTLAARRGEHVESRFLSSGANIAIVDARTALLDGLRATKELGEAVEANAAALLVLVSRTDVAALDDFLAAGATHFLVSPFNEAQFAKAIRFAQRHVDRVGGGSRRDEEGAGAPVSWRWRPGTRTVELSPSLARQAGLSAEAGQKASVTHLLRKLGPVDRRAAFGAVERLLETGEATAFAHGESADRLAHHVRLGAHREVVGTTEAMTSPAAQLSRDAMTGVHDGRAARAWMAQHLATSEYGEPRIIVILLALNRFDAINAAFGRAVGDITLQAAARRIEHIVGGQRRDVVVARMAGAEFTVLLPAPAQLQEARLLASGLAETLAKPFMSGGHMIGMACRAGIATSAPGDDWAQLMRRASAALAVAKDSERGPIQVITGGAVGDAGASERLDIDLRRALDQDEIDILFQPQVSIATGAIDGVEALARWKHPDHGELGAALLFSVAEQSDYVVQLSDHIQRKALAEAAAWPATLGHLRMAVNITAEDIVRPGFVREFMGWVRDSGFSPDRLTVEVTESSLIADLGAAADVLAGLRARGVRIAIDDFGTGYSNLAYLKAFPLDYLKIDKKLSDDISGNSRDRIVVRGVIDMARSLGLGVVAEGVESEDQLGLLAREGCTLYQGYLCSPAVDSSALEMLVGARAAA